MLWFGFGFGDGQESRERKTQGARTRDVRRTLRILQQGPPLKGAMEGEEGSWLLYTRCTAIVPL